ncbi:hypothetical protein Spiaf_1542 [Spirochaeta africana DSM 8902]|uniref:Ribosome maturation factor RimP n=1 Tax=Spirochaeta africana (strain ATCC 700263 / DSM 8902 / Z-7692) TaxID=889378 RepID=H9UJA8_SPIAZ|nr:hypothetical protein Spiaf_1542 [Spirochaeta africana DSM 8902]
MNPKEQELLEELSPIVEGLGITIVDLSFAIAKGRRHLVLILYRSEGLGHKDLEQVHRTVQARMEMLDPHGHELSLEISTPGIDRNLKNDREYAIFIGKGIRILPVDDSEWIRGVLVAADEETITIEQESDTHRISRAMIRKAKLDSQQDRR